MANGTRKKNWEPGTFAQPDCAVARKLCKLPHEGSFTVAVKMIAMVYVAYKRPYHTRGLKVFLYNNPMGGQTVILIFQMRKLRHRGMRNLSQAHGWEVAVPGREPGPLSDPACSSPHATPPLQQRACISHDGYLAASVMSAALESGTFIKNAATLAPLSMSEPLDPGLVLEISVSLCGNETWGLRVDAGGLCTSDLSSFISSI